MEMNKIRELIFLKIKELGYTSNADFCRKNHIKYRTFQSWTNNISPQKPKISALSKLAKILKIDFRTFHNMIYPEINLEGIISEETRVKKTPDTSTLDKTSIQIEHLIMDSQALTAEEKERLRKSIIDDINFFKKIRKISKENE